MRRKLEAVALHALVIAAAILTAAPLLWMVSASFMRPGAATSSPPPLLPAPHTATLEHYRALFTSQSLGRYLLNSLVIAGCGTLLGVAITAMAGYGFAKLRFRGRDPLFRNLVLLMVVPGQVAMLPMFLELRELGLINTLFGAMIPVLAPIYGVFLVRQYALSIPGDLLDAARIDGASELRIFRSIVLPTIAPVLVTLGVFTFLSAWNDFMWPLIVLSDDARYTLPVALANLAGEHVQDTELMMSGAVVTVLPVFLAFLFLQRYYIQGIMAGSTKG
ncbi:MAG: sugar ABC transporter permease [Gemmatimonadetes bacterium]|nr:MAG: sugar ABC transporter permease [Gemmatimonadota bacterium]